MDVVDKQNEEIKLLKLKLADNGKSRKENSFISRFLRVLKNKKVQ